MISAERLLANDVEHDGETLRVTAVRNDHGGTARLLDNGTVLFEPDSNFNGEAWFEYQITDDHNGFSWARATLVYAPVNDRPAVGNDHYGDEDLSQFLTGKEDEAIEVPILELLKNDYDIEGFSIFFEQARDAIHGDITLSADGTKIIFTPDKDYWGEATFAYSVTDPEGAVNGGIVTLWFENVGDGPPVAGPNTIEVFEDIPTVIPISALLGNDYDIDRDPLYFLDFAPLRDLHGTLEYNAAGDILFTPWPDATTSSGFTYTVTDRRDGTAQGVVDIVIIPSNDDPTVMFDEGFITPLDIPLVIRVADVLFNDFDIEQVDTNGDGIRDVDLDEPNRPRPRFVGIEAILDPAQLALGNRVSVGEFKVVEFRGEKFIVVQFPAGFSGQVMIEYKIADAQGLTDVGFAKASVSDFYAGLLKGSTKIDYVEGGALVDTIRTFIADDRVLGMAGDDVIDTNAGADVIDGGDGDDWIDAGDDGDHITGGEGFDTVVFAGSNIGVTANLESRVGLGGFAHGDTYIGIEALVGTGFGDELGGDSAENRLEGLDGDDQLHGRGGEDILLGGAGDDVLRGGGGAAGTVDGGDRLDGGDGSDTATYFNEDGTGGAGVAISLAAGTASGGEAEGDVLVSIENLIGTDFADTLIGDSQANRIQGGRGEDQIDGGAGDDTLIGGRGADILAGGEGVDTVVYSGSVEGVTIDLADMQASSGDAQGDVLSGIEIVEGSFQDDVIRGSDADNRLRGGRGADVIDGRGGFDTADYARADEAVTVDLAQGKGLAGEALGDTLIGIEKLLGSIHADTFIGSSGSDTFDGGYGDDQLRGGFGSDIYLFGFDSGEDILTEVGGSADIDRLVLSSALAPKDVSLMRVGDDLFVEIEKDDGLLPDTVTVTNHFLGASTGIEEIVFANGTVWDRDRIETLLRVGRFNAQNDIYRFGVEDEVVIIDPATLILNDATEGVDQLTFVSVEKARFGTVTLRADGMIEFRGAPNHFGDAFFEYTVRDQFGRESAAEVEVNLSPVNDAPIGVNDDLVYAVEDEVLRIRIDNLLANDYDVDGDHEFEELRIVKLEPLRNLAGEALDPYKHKDYTGESTHFAWKIDGAYIELKPRPDYFGFAGFTYTLADREGATGTASVEIYVSPVNDAPRLDRQEHSVRLETTTTITVAQLMARVYDIEGDGFTFQGLHPGADENPTDNGSAVFDSATQTIAYTPDALGEATIQFNVIDARGAAATLNYKLKVRPLNDPPIARNDYGLRTLEDTVLIIDPATILANDSDENGDIILLSAVERFADNGKVRINEAGMIEFRPRADYNGAAGFEYTISDGRGGFDTAYVSITVMPRNEAPILRNDLVTGLEDKPLYVIPGEAFGNDIDRDGDVIFFKRSTVLGALTHKFLSPDYEVVAKLGNNRDLPDWLSFDAATMSFSGTMPAGRTEPVEVVIFIRDPNNGATHPHRFSLDAEDLAEAAPLRGEVMAGYKIRESFALGVEFGAARMGDGVTAAASLADGSALPDWLSFDPATLRFTGTPPAGATDAFDVAITFTYQESGSAPVSFVEEISIDPAQVQAVQAGIRYDSDIALFDISRGSFSASLIGGRPLPDWLSFDTETMTLKLTGFEPDADAPVARLQIVFTPQLDEELPENTYRSSKQGFTLEFVIDPRQPLDPAINALLSNDPFFAAQGLFALDLGAAGSIQAERESRAPLPSWLSFNAETLSFAGMPPSSYVGAVPVRLNIGGDGSTLPSLSVITDVVVDRTFTVKDELEGLSGSTLAERVNLFAPEDFNGSVGIEYLARDEKGAVSSTPAYIVFNVTPQAERPDPVRDRIDTVENGLVTVAVTTLLDNDRDDDGDSMRVTAIGSTSNGTLTLNLATVTLDPPAGLSAGEGAIWSAALADGSALPSWMTVDSATGRITAVVPLDMLGALDIKVSATLGATVQSAVIRQAFDGNAGATISYQGNSAFSGLDSFTYTVTDDRQGPSTGTVDVHVAPLFDPPTANQDSLLATEDTPLVISPAALLANDIDVDGDPIRFLGVLNPVNGTISFDGIDILFTPDANFSGQARFEYEVTDDNHGSSIGTVLLDVRSTNRAPIAATDIIATVEDTPFEFTPAMLLANDSDPDGDEFRFVSISRTHEDGRIIELPGGRFQFVPDENVTGPVSFSYVITDGRLSKTGTVTFDVAAVNDAPIANTDGVGTGNNPTGIFVGDQDQPLIIDIAHLIANDRDVEGDSFSLVEIFDGDNGDVVRVGNTAVFTGREGYYGDAGFHYRVTDVHGATSIGYVNLTIMPEFDLPIAVSDTGLELFEDGYIDIDPALLMANDYVPEGTTPIFLGLNGSGVTALANGLYRFAPAADFFGKVTLTYAITNESGFAIPTTVTINVLPVSDNPVAVADTLDMVEDQPLTIFTTQLLANDYDVDRQAIVLTRILDTNGLTVTDNGIGQLIITPNADFSGAAWFDYEIEDSSGIATTARVAVTIAAVNDAPVIAALPVLTGREDQPFSAVLPAGTFSDADGDVLLIEARAPGGGALPDWLTFDRATRTFSGMPPADFNGTVAVELLADDRIVVTKRQIVISIAPANDSPDLAAPLADLDGAEDQAFSFALQTSSFTDRDGDSLSFAVTLADGSPLPDWVSFDGATLSGQPPADFHGTLSLRIVASDGELSAADLFDLRIAPVNDRPTVETPLADVATDEDQAIDIAVPVSTFGDVDGDTLSVTARLADGSALPAWLTFENGRITGTPPANFHGIFDIEVTASDGALAVADVFRLTVNAVNDSPALLIPLADRVSAEDQAIDFALPAGSFGDLDGDALTLSATLEDGSPLPSWLSFDSAAGRFTGTPPADYNGLLSIAVTATDGSLSVGDVFTLQIAGVNDAPVVAAPLADLIVPEDGLIDLAIPAGTFSDVDGDALGLSARLADGSALPAWLSFDGARFTGTPPADYNGFIDIEVVASDGSLSVSDRFRLTVTPENDPPVLLEPIADAVSVEDQPVDILLPAGLFGDVDGDTLTLTATLAGGDPLPEWLSFDGARFTGTPPLNFNGAIDIVVTASDGVLSVGDTFRLTIDPANDRPTLEAALADVVRPEDGAIDVAIPLGAFADVDGDTLTLTATLAGGAALPLWLSFDGRRLTGTPPADFNGALDIEVTASDGALTAADSFRLTISPVNDPPVLLTAIADVSGDEDQPIDILLPAGTFGDIDGDALTLTASLAGGDPLPAWLSFDGARFTGTPPANFNGSIDIAVTASDGALAVSDTFRLTINPVNDAPTLETLLADAHRLEDSLVDLAVPEGSFADLDGDSLTLTATLANGDPLPSWLSFDGARFTGTPPANFNGSIDLRVTADDGLAAVSDTFTLTIDPVNDRPVLVAALADSTGREDFAIDLTLPQGSFADVDGDQLVLSATLSNGGALPGWLTFANGRFTGTPPLNFNGSLEIEVLASDGALAVADVFRLTISPENDPPVVFAPLADAVYAEDHAFDIAVPTDTFRDADGDSLTLTATLANGDGLPAWMSFSGGRIVGTPPLNFNGSVDIKVTASDGIVSASDTFRLTILAVNDSPTLEQILPDVVRAEDMAIDFAIPAGTFADVDGDSLALSATLAGGGALPEWLSFQNGRFTGTPPANFNGALDIRVTASDGQLSATESFTLTLTPVNDSPVAGTDVPDSVQPGGYPFEIVVPTSAFTDVDGDALTVTARLVGGAPLPSWLHFDGTRLTGTPPRSMNAAFAVELVASDGQATASQVFALTITPSNASPALGTPIGTVTIAEDSALNFAVPASAFTDPDGDTLQLSATLANGAALPAWLAFAGGRFTGTPPANYNGSLALKVTASDGEFQVSQSFDLVVTAVNDAPTAVADGLFLVKGGDTLTIAPAALLENDSDVEGSTLSVVSVANGAHGVARISATGEIVYTPDLGFTGEDSFQYSISDGNLSGSSTVRVQVSDPFAGWQQGSGGSDNLKGNMTSANDIFAAGGDDHVKGGKLADKLAGGDGDDHLQGMQGDDLLYGMAGNDKLNGGDGFDTAVLAGDRSTYVLTTLNGELRITDMDAVANGNEGTDTLVGIERLSFRGGETLSIASPIVIDLDGDGNELLNAGQSNASFDMDGDGKPDDTSWFGSGDAILFLDRDGNGTVTNAKEFSFVQDAENARSDLEGLRAFDSNKDGKLSSADEKFGQFRLWQDRNGDGVAAASEITTLATSNLASISLTGTPTNLTAAAGSAVAINTGQFTRSDGSQGMFSDAALTYYSGATGAKARIDLTHQSFDKKAKKYHIIAQGGELFVALTKKKGDLDPGSGRIGPSTLLNFKGKTIGMLAPIILDLDGDGIEMVARDKSKAMFDMDGDGNKDDTGWIGKGDGFLVIDRDNDGLISGAAELSFLSEKPGARSDLDALSALDSNRDRKIDATDLRFGELKVWVDSNRNGFTDAGELKTLQELNIASIDLAGSATQTTAKVGDNVLLATGSFTLANGTVRSLGDAALAFRPSGGAVLAESAAAFDLGLPAGFRGNVASRLAERLAQDADLQDRMDAQRALDSSVPPGFGGLAALAASAQESLDAQLGLTESLRAGLGGNRAAVGSAGLSLGLPSNVDPFEYFADLPGQTASSAASSAGGAALGRQDIPEMQLADSGLSASSDELKVARMVHAMASFVRPQGEGDWTSRQREVPRFDYFA